MKTCIFFPLMYRKEKKKPSKQIGEDYQSGSTKSWGPCNRSDLCPEAEAVRTPPDPGELSQGRSRSTVSVPTHSSTENISKGAKQHQLQLGLLFKYQWAPVR